MVKSLILLLFLNITTSYTFVTSAVPVKVNKRLNIADYSQYKGLFLVQPDKKYAQKYVLWWGRQNAIKYNPMGALNVEEYERYFNYLSQKQAGNATVGHYIWFVMSEKDGEIVASVSIHSIDTASKFGYIAYVVSEGHQRQGIGTKSAYLVLEKAFDQMNFHKVYATVVPENIASAKILEKYGFQKEGYLREHMVMGDKNRKDMILFGLLRSEWNLAKKKIKDSDAASITN